MRHNDEYIDGEDLEVFEAWEVEQKRFDRMVRSISFSIWIVTGSAVFLWIMFCFSGCSYVFDLPFHTEASISWGANQRMERSLVLDQGAPVASPSPSPAPLPKPILPN